MQLRNFHAKNMPQALQLIREHMGERAILVSSRRDPSTDGVRVTAALDRAEDVQVATHTPAPAMQQELSSEAGLAADTAALHPHHRMLLEQCREVLCFHGLSAPQYKRIMESATYGAMTTLPQEATPTEMLQVALRSCCAFRPLQWDPPPVLMLVGAPGVGKTCAVAKLAALHARHKRPVSVITLDNTRAGGVEQLEAFTSILQLTLRIATSPQELHEQLACVRAAQQSAAGRDATGAVIIDTAGVNPYDFAQMQTLRAYAALQPIEPVLVMPAGGDTHEAEEVAQAFSLLPIERMLITRTDSVRRMGSVLAAALVGDLAFCNLSAGVDVAQHCAELDAHAMARLLLRHLQPQEDTPQKAAP